MYKAIKSLSERQKRRKRQQILRGVHSSLATGTASLYPISVNKIDENETEPNQQFCEPTTSISKKSNILPCHLPSEAISSVCNADSLLPFDEYNKISNFNLNNTESDTDSQCSCSECNHCYDSADLIEDLKSWAVTCNIPLNHTSKLLQILKKHNINVPGDARTLLHTPRSVDVTVVEPGRYCHIGIQTSILKDLKAIPEEFKISPTIKINIGIDGLPLSKSSGSQFWPILGWFANDTFLNLSPKPFVIGMYHGNSKPKLSNDFLKNFVDEFLQLKQTGIIWEGNKVDVDINALICDAPAKAFVKCIKGHTGYHGCDKCIQEGDFLNNRMSFSELGNALRTDESFKNKIDEDHHTGVSILENLGIGLVTQFPLDYMHLVCLGVMKRLLQFWYKGKQNIRLPAATFEALGQLILSYKDFITEDFCRKPRSLLDVDRFKATEFRQFLLYTGVVGLKDLLPDNMYLHFLHLSCAIRILTSPTMCINLNELAQKLLDYFINMYSEIYGPEYITYNVHNLTHLCNDVLNFGCLDNFSAFPAESYMSKLKKKLCLQSGKPLQQIIKRLNEETRENHFEGGIELSKNKKSTKLRLKHYVLSNTTPDNYCLLKNGNYVAVSDIAQRNKDILITGKTIILKGSFFTRPIDSRTLGIQLCNLNNGLKVSCNIEEILCKAMLLPYKNDFVVLPLVHTSDNTI